MIDMEEEHQDLGGTDPAGPDQAFAVIFFTKCVEDQLPHNATRPFTISPSIESAWGC